MNIRITEEIINQVLSDMDNKSSYAFSKSPTQMEAIIRSALSEIAKAQLIKLLKDDASILAQITTILTQQITTTFEECGKKIADVIVGGIREGLKAEYRDYDD